MKKSVMITLLAASAMLTSIEGMAADEPVTTCTNSCVITHHSNGSITIEDCCGGRVITVYPPSPEPIH